MSRVSISTRIRRHSGRLLTRIAPIAIALALVVALLPAAAEAKRVKSRVSLDVFGIIDRQGEIEYFFAGEVFARGLTFRCMARRRVVLFRDEPDRPDPRVGFAKSNFLGIYFARVNRDLEAIPGDYYVRVKRRKVKRSRGGRLRCLAARSRTITVRPPRFGEAGETSSSALSRSTTAVIGR
jgi:hypothetical protein